MYGRPKDAKVSLTGWKGLYYTYTEGFVLHLYGKGQLPLLVMYLIIYQMLDLIVCDGLKSEPKTRSDN
jgi:hypothetical protein